MSNKRKAIITGCAASSMGMIAMTTTAVLAYIIGTYAQMGVPTSRIVSIMTIQPLVGVFMAFLTGPISAKIPKKVLLTIALGLVIVNGVIFTVGGGRWNFGWLMLASAFTGIVSGIICTVPNSVVSEYADDYQEQGKMTGWNNAFLQGGALILSAVGGVLGAVRWQNAYYLYFLAIPALIIVLVLCPKDVRPEVKSGQEKPRIQLRKIPGRVWLMCLHYFVFFICCYTFSVYISEYIITDFQLGTSVHSGIATALVTISAVIAGATYSRYNKKLSRWFMPFFCLTMLIGYVLCSTLTATLAGCLVGAFLIGIGKTAIVPYVIGQASSRVPGYMIPVTISMIMGSMNLGMFVSSYLTGWMSRTLLSGETTLNRFVSTAILCVIALVFAILLYTVGASNKKKNTAEAKA